MISLSESSITRCVFSPAVLTEPKIFKQMFTDYNELHSLFETADILAQISDWPDLYDEGQLARNEVPVYAATFLDDLYVDYKFAQETAKKIKGCKVFVTNAMYHDAIRSKSDAVLEELFKLRDDVID